MVATAKALAEVGLEKLGQYLPGQTAFDKLEKRAQDEVLRFLTLGPELMDQIGYWLRTGKVASGKIISPEFDSSACVSSVISIT
jgi:hypothetical protein